MKVSAAIPHYNSAHSLDDLLRQLVEDSFDSIVVLDDHSKDRDSLRRLETSYPTVTFCYGTHNVGAGANRNRALDYIDEGIVWFIDADMQVVSANNAARLRRLFRSYPHRLIGGLILEVGDVPMQWNYGHFMHPAHDARFEELVRSYEAGDATAWKRLQVYGWDYAWLDPDASPQMRSVDFVAEGSFAMSIELFRKVGGYDTAFRWHEGQDLTWRLRGVDVKPFFEPSLVTRHLRIDVRGARRKGEIEAAQLLFYQKHWGMSESVWKKLYS